MANVDAKSLLLLVVVDREPVVLRRQSGDEEVRPGRVSAKRRDSLIAERIIAVQFLLEVVAFATVALVEECNVRIVGSKSRRRISQSVSPEAEIVVDRVDALERNGVR